MGMTLLQHAEASGSVETKCLILNLGQQHGLPWPHTIIADMVTSGLPISHVLASKASAPDDGGVLANSILRKYDAACDALFRRTGTLSKNVNSKTAVLDTHTVIAHCYQSGGPSSGAQAFGVALETCASSSTRSSIMDPPVGCNTTQPQHGGHDDTSKCATASNPAGSVQSQHSSSLAQHQSSLNKGTCIAALSVSADVSTPDIVSAHVRVPFPEAAYRLWLSRRNAVYCDQFYTIIFFLVLLATIRKLFEARPGQEYASLVFLVFHVLRKGGKQAHPAWFERHSEFQHIAWHALKIAFQLVAVALGWPYGAGPPLPYLMYFDWMMEGILPTLCVQVRGVREML